MMCNDCNEEISFQYESIVLKVGCEATACAYPCRKCGRLHFSSGDSVITRSGKKAYLINGEMTHK